MKGEAAKHVTEFLADYMALCMYYKIMITACCGKPFLKELGDDEGFAAELLKKFMDGLRDEKE